MKNLITILFLSSLTILMFSCKDDKLQRQIAQAQITMKMGFPQKVTTEDIKNEVEIGWGNYTTKNGLIDDESKYWALNDKNRRTYESMSNEGLISLDSITKEIGYDGPEENRNHEYKAYWEAILTEMGQQYVSGNAIILADKVFDKITGITEDKQLNTNTVYYDYKQTNITPFGKILNIREEVFHASATFRKYDDGWRIEN